MLLPSRVRLLVLCLLLASTGSLLVVATGHSENPAGAQIHAIYFTADFLSSQFSYEAGRHFDSKPCVDGVYASERTRSLRYLFGPTMDKAMNYQEYLKSRTKALSQPIVEFNVRFYMPFPADRVYAHSLKGTLPAVDSSAAEGRRRLTTGFAAYISMPSPFIDQVILDDLEHGALFEIVCFKTASKLKKEMRPKLEFILEQIINTGLLEQGQQIRKRQLIAAYLGKDHTQRTYSQRILEDSKPRDGEEVYLLTLPEQSDPFYPGSFKDPQWTFELVIKFLTYALPALLKSHDNRSRVCYFSHYLNKSGIIPGISTGLIRQQSEKTTSFFSSAFAQSQKYRFLQAKSTISVMSYRGSFIAMPMISPPIRCALSTPSIPIGARRTLLQGNEAVVYAYAEIRPALGHSVNLFLLRKLQMSFRIPKGLADETAKRAEALRQLLEMTELNGLEESLDLEERILASNSHK